MPLKIKTATKIDRKTFERLSKELALDFEAIFTEFEAKLMEVIREAESKEWDVDKLITELELIK